MQGTAVPVSFKLAPVMEKWIKGTGIAEKSITFFGMIKSIFCIRDTILLGEMPVNGLSPGTPFTHKST